MPVRFEIVGAPYPNRGYMSALNGRLIEIEAREREAESRLLDVQAEKAALEAEIAHLEGKRMAVAS